MGGRREGCEARHVLPFWLSLALLTGLPFLLHWRLFALNPLDRGSFPHGDFSVQFYAFARYQAQRLQAGQLPLWSDGAYSGFPFLADIQAASLYPPRWLTVALASPWGFPYAALELEAVLHFSLVGVLSFLLGRQLFRSNGVAVVTALTFAFSGYMTGYPSQQLAILESGAWLPLAILAVERGVTLGWRSRWTAVGGAALALALLAGHPQTAMLVAYTTAVYALWRGGWRRGGSFSLAAGGLAVVLAAGQLWPTAQYTALSSRAGSTYEAMAGGLPLQDLVQVLLPGVVSGPSPFYIGMMGLFFVAAALLLSRERPVPFWTGMAAVALVLSFGDQAFLHSLFALVAPGWRLFRGQERLALVVAWSLAMLAGYGLQALLARPEGLRRFAHGGLALPGVLLLAACALAYGLIAEGWTAASGFYWPLASAAFVALMAGLAWMALHGWTAGGFRRRAFVALVAALLLLDLFTVGWQLNFSGDPATAREAAPAVVVALQAEGGEGRTFNEFRLDGNYGVQFGVEDVWGASPLRLARYEELMARLPWEASWPLLAVSHVVTWREELPLPSAVVHAEPAPDGSTTYAHRLEAEYPRAWLVGRAERLPSEQVLERLAQPEFDLRAVALLEREAPALAGQPVSGQVQWLERSPERQRLQVNADGAALLVLSEVAYPGWRVWVDGDAAEAVTADYALRSVTLPAGSHTVEWRFQPTSWAVASGLSALAWVAVGGWLLLPRRR